jgi:hypothetical protein
MNDNESTINAITLDYLIAGLKKIRKRVGGEALVALVVEDRDDLYSLENIRFGRNQKTGQGVVHLSGFEPQQAYEIDPPCPTGIDFWKAIIEGLCLLDRERRVFFRVAQRHHLEEAHEFQRNNRLQGKNRDYIDRAFQFDEAQLNLILPYFKPGDTLEKAIANYDAVNGTATTTPPVAFNDCEERSQP